jgi:hypothetical protein
MVRSSWLGVVSLLYAINAAPASAPLLRSVVHPSANFRTGDRAWLFIQPERCILFAAGS